VVPGDGGTRQIEADHLIPQVGAKVGGNCSRDLDGGELQAERRARRCSTEAQNALRHP
jgi:hypothetical protein